MPGGAFVGAEVLFEIVGAKSVALTSAVTSSDELADEMPAKLMAKIPRRQKLVIWRCFMIRRDQIARSPA